MNIKMFYQRGLSLVEVMVGLLMGMIVLLVIMQAFTVAEGYKRTTTTGSDSQINGLMALRKLESEIRMAGYGLSNNGALCPAINSIDPATGNVASPPLNMMPVKIVDGGTGADTIETLYSSAAAGPVPTRITKAMPTPSNATFVSSTTGFATCDMILFAAKDGSKACTLMQATATFASPAKVLTGSGQSDYNPAGGFNQVLFPPGGYSTSDIVINMGSYINRRFSVNKTASKDEYHLRQSRVTAADDGCNPVDPNPNLDLVSNVVNIQAQYGIAPAGSQQVSCWTNAATTNTGCGITSGSNWSAPLPADVKRIKAVRVAIVTRGALSEKPSTVGGTCDTTTAAPVSWDGGPVINLSTVPNWQCYRYKVYQTVIPLINVIWANT